MQTLGKVLNESIILCTDNERKKIVITNPSEDILKYVLGYKNIIIPDEEPEYNSDTQYVELSVASETDDTIICEYIIKDIPDEPIIG